LSVLKPTVKPVAPLVTCSRICWPVPQQEHRPFGWPRPARSCDESGFIAATVLTLEAATARDFYGGAQGFSNEMACRPVVGRIPVHCLMLDLL